MKQIHIWAAVVCLLLASCSDIRFGDDFLGDHPESSGATLDEMFSSAVNAEPKRILICLMVCRQEIVLMTN